jgi:3-methylcrotonyl-CoA carboxylase beta subunit
MSRIVSKVDDGSEAFRRNAAHNRALAEELRARVGQAALGGPEKHRARHVSRGKLLPRDRVTRLLDPGAPFLEVGQLAASGMYGDEAPGAGVIAGVGRVSGRECMVIANDPTVKGGAYFPLTVKKHLRAQEIARENRLPCIYLVDSGGANLPHQAEVFPDKEHFGRIFYNQANMSAQGIAQIACVMGSCTAGGAYVPAMSDESVIVRNQGTIFLGGPPLVKAATGEVISAEDLGGGDLHARKSGVVDHLADNDEHALSIVRSIVARLNATKRHDLDLAEPVAPKLDPEDLYGIIPDDVRTPYDVREVIARIVDGSDFHEFKQLTARPWSAASRASGACRSRSCAITASCSREAPQGRAFRRARLPAPDALAVPPEHLRLHGRRQVRSGRHRQGRRQAGDGGRDRAGAEGDGADRRQLRARQLRHERPRLRPAFLFTWPNSRISVMGGEQAASVLATVHKDAEKWTPEEAEAFKAPIRQRYEDEGNPYYATARLWDDGVIDPVQTRDVLGLAFSACLNAPIPERAQFGLFRM